LYLILCCLTICCAPVQFGYNIGVISLPMNLITQFYAENYYNQSVLNEILNLPQTNETYFANLERLKKHELKYSQNKGNQIYEKACLEYNNLTCEKTIEISKIQLEKELESLNKVFELQKQVESRKTLLAVKQL
jgi:hypothetical protein